MNQSTIELKSIKSDYNDTIIQTAFAKEAGQLSDFVNMNGAINVKRSRLGGEKLKELELIFKGLSDPVNFFNHLIHSRSIQAGKDNPEDKIHPDKVIDAAVLANKTLNLNRLGHLKIEMELCRVLGLDFKAQTQNYSFALTVAQEYYYFLKKHTEGAENREKLLSDMISIVMLSGFYLDTMDRLYLMGWQEMPENTQEIFWFIYSKTVAETHLKDSAEEKLIHLINHTHYTTENNYKQSIFGDPEGLRYWECYYASLCLAVEFYRVSGQELNFSEDNQKLFMQELINQCHLEEQQDEPRYNAMMDVWLLVINHFNIKTQLLEASLKDIKKSQIKNDSPALAIGATLLEKHFLGRGIEETGLQNASIVNKI